MRRWRRLGVSVSAIWNNRPRHFNIFANINENPDVTEEKRTKLKTQLDIPERVGFVRDIKGCAARVEGLDHVQKGELLEFDQGIQGLVVDIRKNDVTAAILGEEGSVGKGGEVSPTGKSLSIPVGSGVLGRVLDVTGKPIDGLGNLKDVMMRDFEWSKVQPYPSSSIEPIFTNIKVFDVFRPLVKGGKFGIFGFLDYPNTKLALRVVESQRANEDMYFVYIGVGKSRLAEEKILAQLEEMEIMNKTTVVFAGDGAGAVLQYFAPVVGCLISDFFRDNGM
eukprot:1332063-Amorphochlora_amoeboformis.AAC.1